MRNIICIASLVLLSSFTHVSMAQCNADELSNTSITKLAEGFNFLKSYRVSGEGNRDKVEYSYVFTKGTQYMITLCDQEKDGNSIVVTIYDAERRKVASNMVNGSILSGIAYPCNATGIYYLQYTFEGQSSRCGGSALGFKK